MAAETRAAASTCVSGWVMRNATTALIPDIYTNSRVPIEAYRPTFVRSLLMVPVRAPHPVGAIGLYWATPHVAPSRELQGVRVPADMVASRIDPQIWPVALPPASHP